MLPSADQSVSAQKTGPQRRGTLQSHIHSLTLVSIGEARGLKRCSHWAQKPVKMPKKTMCVHSGFPALELCSHISSLGLLMTCLPHNSRDLCTSSMLTNGDQQCCSHISHGLHPRSPCPSPLQALPHLPTSQSKSPDDSLEVDWAYFLQSSSVQRQQAGNKI